MKNNQQHIAMRVSLNTIAINLLLTVFKLVAGILGRSTAMLSDAAHSLSDVLSTIVVMIGVKLAGKDPDEDHPYGHERLECVAAILLAGMLFATGVGIGWTGFSKIYRGDIQAIAPPGGIALVAALLSLLIKEGMFWYTRSAAKQTGSGALMADAWHHRSDALSSVGSFLGILGARVGFPVLDPVAAIVISFFVIKAAWDIFRDSIGKMTDRSCDESVVEEIRSLITLQEDVLRVDQIKTRIFGERVYVDVEISADAGVTLQQAHETAQQVHDIIESRFPQVKHCMVHVNPLETEDFRRQAP